MYTAVGLHVHVHVLVEEKKTQHPMIHRKKELINKKIHRITSSSNVGIKMELFQYGYIISIEYKCISFISFHLSRDCQELRQKHLDIGTGTYLYPGKTDDMQNSSGLMFIKTLLSLASCQLTMYGNLFNQLTNSLLRSLAHRFRSFIIVKSNLCVLIHYL